MEGPIVGFLLATTVGLGLTIATVLVARKSGLAPVQERLVDNLQDNVKALEDKVALLEEKLADETRRRILVEQQIVRMRNGMADLASENAELRRKLGLPKAEMS